MRSIMRSPPRVRGERNWWVGPEGPSTGKRDLVHAGTVAARRSLPGAANPRTRGRVECRPWRDENSSRIAGML